MVYLQVRCGALAVGAVLEAKGAVPGLEGIVGVEVGVKYCGI